MRGKNPPLCLFLDLFGYTACMPLFSTISPDQSKESPRNHNWWRPHFHSAHWTHHTKCKIAYNRLTLYPDLSPHLALQLYKVFIRSKLEFGCTVWCFRIHNAKHLKLLESAGRSAISLILKTMKSTPTDALESQLSILSIDPCLEELHQYEAV